MSKRLRWPPIIAEAARIVASYDILVSLRQVFYRLFAAGMIPNTLSAYNRLGRLTAAARRGEYPKFNDDNGLFPYLVDHGRRIERPFHFNGVDHARRWLHDAYLLDRTAGQPFAVYLGCEKNTLAGLLQDWFEDRGLPVVSVRGQSSQALVDDVIEDIASEVSQATAAARKNILLWVGDFDPSGFAIPENFRKRVGLFHEVQRIAVLADQVAGLPTNQLETAKPDDPNYPVFVEACRQHGVEQLGWATTKRGQRVPLFPQVEAEAIDPARLRQMIEDTLAGYWDDDAYQVVLKREKADRQRLSPRRGG